MSLTDNLCQSASAGNVGGVKGWLKKGARATGTRTVHSVAGWSTEGETALHAVSAGPDIVRCPTKLAVIDILIKKGAKVDAQNSRGQTPLHCAVINCKPGVVKALIDRGADPRKEQEDGNTPYSLLKVSQIGSWSGKTMIAKALYDAGVKGAKASASGSLIATIIYKIVNRIQALVDDS